jgi:hypothetical protein
MRIFRSKGIGQTEEKRRLGNRSRVLVFYALLLPLACWWTSSAQAAEVVLVRSTASSRAAELYQKAINGFIRAFSKSTETFAMEEDLMDPARLAEAVRREKPEKKIPLFVFSERFVAKGALCSYSADYDSQGKQAARIAKAIISGTPAGEIPTQAPDGTLVINIATAAKLGIPISAELISKPNVMTVGK